MSNKSNTLLAVFVIILCSFCKNSPNSEKTVRMVKVSPCDSLVDYVREYSHNYPEFVLSRPSPKRIDKEDSTLVYYKYIIFKDEKLNHFLAKSECNCDDAVSLFELAANNQSKDWVSFLILRHLCGLDGTQMFYHQDSVDVWRVKFKEQEVDKWNKFYDVKF